MDGGLLSFSNTFVKIDHTVFAGTETPNTRLARTIVRVEDGEISLVGSCFVGNEPTLTPILALRSTDHIDDVFWQRRNPDALVPVTYCPLLASSDSLDGPFTCVSPTSLLTCSARCLTNVTAPLLPCEPSLTDIQRNEEGIVNENIVRTYILCPMTEYEMENPLVITRPNTRILCGADGKSRNDCRLTGGAVQLKVDGTLAPHSIFSGAQPLSNLLIHGVTFTEGEKTNVLVKYPCDLTLEKCIFMVCSW